MKLNWPCFLALTVVVLSLSSCGVTRDAETERLCWEEFCFEHSKSWELYPPQEVYYDSRHVTLQFGGDIDTFMYFGVDDAEGEHQEDLEMWFEHEYGDVEGGKVTVLESGAVVGEKKTENSTWRWSYSILGPESRRYSVIIEVPESRSQLFRGDADLVIATAGFDR